MVYNKSADKQPVDKKPAFATDFPRYTRVLLWINLLGALLVLGLAAMDLWEGQRVEMLKKLPLLLVFLANGCINRQALKNKRQS